VSCGITIRFELLGIVIARDKSSCLELKTDQRNSDFAADAAYTVSPAFITLAAGASATFESPWTCREDFRSGRLGVAAYIRHLAARRLHYVNLRPQFCDAFHKLEPRERLILRHNRPDRRHIQKKEGSADEARRNSVRK
jgi:hypothetical protein